MFKFSILFLYICCSVLADTINGRVVAVTDGDTIKILDASKTEHKIRLYGIDAPEKAQDYGQRSKQSMSDKVYNQTVRVEYTNRDQYGRIVGKVYRGNQYINLAMVEDGLAWHYVQYARKEDDLRRAQEQAKAARRGLWADKEPVAPWTWRRLSKEKRKVQ